MLMGIGAIFFYIFAFILLSSALMVVFARNPVHSVLFLILAFFNAAALFLLSGAEFLAMILMIVYVGAVAVLFLFVVMMLDIDFAAMKKGVLKNAPLGIVIGLIFLIELVLVFSTRIFPKESISYLGQISGEKEDIITNNTVLLGNVLYTEYAFYFEIAGLILLVAMIGAIVLTLRHKSNVKRQVIKKQISRDVEDSIELKDIESGRGI